MPSKDGESEALTFDEIEWMAVEAVRTETADQDSYVWCTGKRIIMNRAHLKNARSSIKLGNFSSLSYFR